MGPAGPSRLGPVGAETNGSDPWAEPRAGPTGRAFFFAFASPWFGGSEPLVSAHCAQPTRAERWLKDMKNTQDMSKPGNLNILDCVLLMCDLS
jgi:hypothetical protein